MAVPQAVVVGVKVEAVVGILTDTGEVVNKQSIALPGRGEDLPLSALGQAGAAIAEQRDQLQAQLDERVMRLQEQQDAQAIEAGPETGPEPPDDDE